MAPIKPDDSSVELATGTSVTAPPPTQRVDLTTLPRRERRRIGKKFGGKIKGRMLPFSKAAHGTLKQFNEARAKEMG